MQREQFEKLTGVSLESLLAFNERRLACIGNTPGDERNRLYVQGRIESLKAQIEQSEQREQGEPA